MVRKPLFLVALLSLAIGGELVLAKSSKPNIVPLSASDKALKTCGLHHVRLQTGNVPIVYGLIRMVPGYYEAQHRNFPHANSRALGGCVISKDSPHLQTVKFCPQCRVAEKRWAKALANKTRSR